MDAQQFFKSGKGKFIRKHELRESGPRRLRIAAVETAEGFPSQSGDGPEMELQLVFEGGTRFGLRAQENLNRLCKWFGNETDKWVGKEVEVYFSPDISNPKNPDDPGGIRLQLPNRKSPEQPYRSDLEDDEPKRPVKANGAEHGRRPSDASPAQAIDDKEIPF